MTELLKRAHFELVIRKLKKCKVEYQIKGKPPKLVFRSKHRIPPVPIIISFSESKMRVYTCMSSSLKRMRHSKYQAEPKLCRYLNTPSKRNY